MSKYPEAIIKQAEELIQNHNGTIGKVFTGNRRAQNIKASIVSCEFALPFITQNSFDSRYDKLLQVKEYLEELL